MTDTTMITIVQN